MRITHRFSCGIIVTTALIVAAACGREGYQDTSPGSLDVDISSATTDNLLTNGSFEDGISPWYLNVNNGAGTLVVDTSTTAAGTTSARLTVTRSVGNVWDLAAIEPAIAVTGGEQYTVSFYAKAGSAGREVMVSIAQAYSPWSNYHTQAFSLSKTWHRYSFTFTPAASDSNVEIMFASGQAKGSMWLDAVSLTGSVPKPVLTYSPAALDFGSVDVGSVSSGQTLTFTNSGSADVAISSTTLSGDFTWVHETATTCPANTPIAPGVSCTMLIAFAPQSAGALTGTLTVVSTAVSSPQVIALTGSGVAANPSPAGGLITSFAATPRSTFFIDGVTYAVHNADKSYSVSNPDDHTLRFEIRQGDASEYDGSESVDRSAIQGDPLYAVGQAFNLEYQFMVEPGAANTAPWFVTTQMHNADGDLPFSGGTSPPWAIEMAGESLRVVIRYCESGKDPRNGSADLHDVALWTSPTPIVRGKYYDIKIESSAVNTSAGYMRVWIDGTQVVDYRGMLGYGYATYLESGLYRERAAQTFAAEFRNFTVSPLIR